MKLRDSGMPEEDYWESLFEVPRILSRLGLDSTVSDVAELGCGYGTFTIPVAQVILGSGVRAWIFARGRNKLLSGQSKWG